MSIFVMCYLCDTSSEAILMPYLSNSESVSKKYHGFIIINSFTNRVLAQIDLSNNTKKFKTKFMCFQKMWINKPLNNLKIVFIVLTFLNKYKDSCKVVFQKQLSKFLQYSN